MAKHPTDLPDVVARKLADFAREHGYGIESLTLSWFTKDLGRPIIARVTYDANFVESVTTDGDMDTEAL